MRRHLVNPALALWAGTLIVVGCGGPQVSPVSPTVWLSPDSSASANDAVVSADGFGPGSPATPGTCPNGGAGGGQGPGAGPYGPGGGSCDNLCGDACSGPVGPDPEDIGELLGQALQEEYKAEMLYRSVLEDFGPATRPFSQIAESELRHAGALQQLFARRQLVPPASDWSTGDFPAFATIQMACAAGVEAELADAAFYVPYLQRDDLPADVAAIFTNLRAASLENHLPAFESCR